ncbi:hypothetical protein, partial [Pseudoalteromonas ruthenica]|uniref:hypothetical protein n=1 Tax=Pseudoalteromonas ruthenica TaxID=151081 RepID=UPI00126BFF23
GKKRQQGGNNDGSILPKITALYRPIGEHSDTGTGGVKLQRNIRNDGYYRDQSHYPGELRRLTIRGSKKSGQGSQMLLPTNMSNTAIDGPTKGELQNGAGVGRC